MATLDLLDKTRLVPRFHSSAGTPERRPARQTRGGSRPPAPRPAALLGRAHVLHGGLGLGPDVLSRRLPFLGDVVLGLHRGVLDALSRLLGGLLELLRGVLCHGLGLL